MTSKVTSGVHELSRPPTYASPADSNVERLQRDATVQTFELSRTVHVAYIGKVLTPQTAICVCTCKIYSNNNIF